MRFNNNNQENDIVRYRLYKSKKNWVVASTVFLSFFAVSSATTINSDVVRADETTQSTVSDSTASPSADTSTTATTEASTIAKPAATSTTDERGIFTTSVTINFVDDTDHKLLRNVILTGFLGSPIKYDTASVISKYEGQGYSFVSSDIPATGLVGSYHGTTYTVHMAHKMVTYNAGDAELGNINGIKPLTKDLNVQDTIKLPDGTTTKSSTALIKLNRSVTVDYTKKLADGSFPDNAITYSDWKSPTNAITTIDPGYHKIDGYTPKFNLSYSSNGVVVRINDDGSLNLKFDLTDKNLFAAIHRTISYTPEIQNAKINFIDDDTNSTVKSINLQGNSDSSSSATANETISELLSKHYQLVSSDLEADGSIKFDSDTKTNQVFNVHFKHQTKTITADEPGNGDASLMHRTVTETINFVSPDGTILADPIVKTLEFMRYGTQDLVTGEVTYGSTWIPVAGSNNFDEVSVPDMPGYTANIKKIDSISDVAFDSKNFNYVVTFTKDKEVKEPDANVDSSAFPITDETAKPFKSISVAPTATPSNTEAVNSNTVMTNASTTEATATTTSSAAQNNNYLNKTSLEQSSSFTNSGSTQSNQHVDSNKITVATSGSDDDGGGGGANGGSEDISLGAYFSSLAGTIIFAQS